MNKNLHQLITHHKLSHGDMLVKNEVLLNHVEQEHENISTEKLMLKSLSNKIY